MANLLTVPARNDLPWYKFRISLSGTVFTLYFRYNVRCDRWLMDVYDASDTPIFQGAPILVNFNLLAQYPTLPLPNGTLFAVDDTGNQQQPTLQSFGLTHSLYYADP